MAAVTTMTPADAAGVDRDDPTRPARLLIAAIRLYQLFRAGRTSPCRFTPSCSVYAVEALSRHGARRGLALATRRLGRCRPGGPFGMDPVPE